MTWFFYFINCETIPMKTTSQSPTKLLKQPLVQFLDCVSAPANLSKTLNRLLFENLRQGGTLLPDEAENVNALFDFLLACQVASSTTIFIAEA